jgi:hypothetical protein
MARPATKGDEKPATPRVEAEDGSVIFLLDGITAELAMARWNPFRPLEAQEALVGSLPIPLGAHSGLLDWYGGMARQAHFNRQI